MGQNKEGAEAQRQRDKEEKAKVISSSLVSNTNPSLGQKKE
jgi:hypothetical protein